MRKLIILIPLAIASMAHAQVFGPRQRESDNSWWQQYQEEVRERIDRDQLEWRMRAIEEEQRRRDCECDCDDNFYIRWAR